MIDGLVHVSAGSKRTGLRVANSSASCKRAQAFPIGVPGRARARLGRQWSGYQVCLTYRRNTPSAPA